MALRWPGLAQIWVVVLLVFVVFSSVWPSTPSVLLWLRLWSYCNSQGFVPAFFHYFLLSVLYFLLFSFLTLSSDMVGEVKCVYPYIKQIGAIQVLIQVSYSPVENRDQQLNWKSLFVMLSGGRGLQCLGLTSTDLAGWSPPQFVSFISVPNITAHHRIGCTTSMNTPPSAHSSLAVGRQMMRNFHPMVSFICL